MRAVVATLGGWQLRVLLQYLGQLHLLRIVQLRQLVDQLEDHVRAVLLQLALPDLDPGQKVLEVVVEDLLLPLALVDLPLGPIKLLTVRLQLIHLLLIFSQFLNNLFTMSQTSI